MSWRVVVISKRSKLDYKLGSLVIRTGEEEKRIYLDDISVLICETTAISITAYLLAELTERKIKVIFCDNQHNPSSELIPMYGNYVSSGKIRQQIKWSDAVKANIWQAITERKILNQANNLFRVGNIEKAEQLRHFASEVLPGDSTNREGHAAKVYFNALYGVDFYRDSSDIRNSVLNYGYSIILSCFNREISASGYLTNIGLWHDNANNPFNLGSDLMETFRPIVDLFAHDCDFKCFEKDEKMQVVNLLNTKVKIANSTQYLNNAIGIYVRSVFNAIDENDPTLIINWYEL
jgi:CRISPR-associated endonuclease Cas1 subtype II